MRGVEPLRLAAPDPKSGTSTNFATSALTSASGCYETTGPRNSLLRSRLPVENPTSYELAEGSSQFLRTFGCYPATLRRQAVDQKTASSGVVERESKHGGSFSMKVARPLSLGFSCPFLGVELLCLPLEWFSTRNIVGLSSSTSSIPLPLFAWNLCR